MGQAVVHFEVIGKDGDKLRAFYGELFDWQIDADNDMGYGLVQRDGNLNGDGVGIGGGIAGGPEGYGGHVTFYVEVPDVEAALARAESLGGTRVFGPETIMGRARVRAVPRSRGACDRRRAVGLERPGRPAPSGDARGVGRAGW
jgi:predicted enzyme related to lactoylglutathione lyase